VWHDTPGLFFARDGHPTREGNRRFAETVYGLLVDHHFATAGVGEPLPAPRQ
jgi:hypothetical protein